MTTAGNTSPKTPLWQVIFSIFYPLIFPTTLFWLANTIHWWEGWVFTIIFCGFVYFILIYLHIKDPVLLQERWTVRFQKDQAEWDKIIIVMISLSFFVWFVMMPFDSVRYKWSPEFPLSVKITAIPVMVFSLFLFYDALKQNTFAAPIVKIMEERKQKVISTGSYSIIRHPMYCGGILLFISGAALLGSLYGLIVAFLFIFIMAIRCIGEENLLKQNLQGYEEYMKKVKWRLIPFIF
jgi:protein-S-isoprenylcysteine O-methyltransferase Ste14